MKKLLGLALLALSFTSCEEEALAAALLGSSEVHFTLAESYGELVEVEVEGLSKTVSPGTGSLDPCDGGNYVGIATFLFVSGATKSYTVKDLEGTQVGSGSVTATADCTTVFLN